MRWSLALLAVACGRVDFDSLATPDAAAKSCVAPVGHDEDADGVDDACDGCPHISDPQQPDSDEDGVDNACDPNPTVGGETIAFFDPFVTMRPEWSYNQTFTIANDSMSVPADASIYVAHRSGAIPTTTFTYGGHVGSTFAGYSQLTIGVEGVISSQSYFCELVEDQGVADMRATHTFDGMSYFNDAATPVSLIQNTDLTFTLLNLPASFDCATTHPTSMPRISGALPAIAPDHIVLVAIGVAMRWDYFIEIRTQ